jgi:hypothetical protein
MSTVAKLVRYSRFRVLDHDEAIRLEGTLAGLGLVAAVPG